MTQPQPADASVSVIDATDRSRFEISVDGTLAGFSEYVDATPGPAGTDGTDGADSADSTDGPVERTFPHTIIEEAFEGRGLATLLIRTAMDAARVADLAVIPQCSAVRHFLGKHPEYVDLVPESRRAEFGL